MEQPPRKRTLTTSTALQPGGPKLISHWNSTYFQVLIALIQLAITTASLIKKRIEKTEG